MNMLRYKKKETYLIILGKKGYRALSRKYRSVLRSVFFDLENEGVSFSISYIVMNHICMNTSFDVCCIIYNSFINVFEHVASIFFLPSYQLFFEFVKNNFSKYYCFFKSNTRLFFLDSNYIYNFYEFAISCTLLNAISETKYCVFGARAKAMDLVISNTTELIISLRMAYNNLRQSSITTEIVEILTASIAIK